MNKTKLALMFRDFAFWFLCVVVVRQLKADTPTAITLINPNPASAVVYTSSGDDDGGTLKNQSHIVGANSTLTVTHTDIGDWIGFPITVNQRVDGVTPIHGTGGGTYESPNIYLRDGGGADIRLGTASIGTPKTFTLKLAPSVAWNYSGQSGANYKDDTSDASPGGLQSMVTQELFREGIEKIVAAAGSGGGGGGEGAATATLAAGNLDLLQHPEGTAKTAAERAAAADGAATALTGALGTAAATAKGYTLTPGSVPARFTLALPARMGGATFDLNPFSEGRLDVVASWFRAAVMWSTLIALGVWVWGQFQEWLKAMSVTRQATGNAVAMGTGAQATAFTAAVIITGTVLAAVVGLMAYAFDGISFSSLISQVTTNPIATLPSDAYWLLDQLFPVATIISAVCAKLAFQRFATAIFAGVATVVRFVVP